MGLFDIFKKNSTPTTTLKVGDWVTQYSAGYWQVVGIFPKYADEDYSYGDNSWKKGDRLGDWVVVKKGFTAKMKPSNACEFLDSKNCQLVSQDVVRAIEDAFAENPKIKKSLTMHPVCQILLFTVFGCHFRMKRLILLQSCYQVCLTISPWSCFGNAPQIIVNT